MFQYELKPRDKAISEGYVPYDKKTIDGDIQKCLDSIKHLINSKLCKHACIVRNGEGYFVYIKD